MTPCGNPMCLVDFEQAPNGRKKFCSRACQLTVRRRGGYPYTTWRRQLAVSESLALRGLVRAYGRMPTHQPAVVLFTDYEGEYHAARAREYRARKKREAA